MLKLRYLAKYATKMIQMVLYRLMPAMRPLQAKITPMDSTVPGMA